MILALDLYGTISTYPERCRELAYAVKADGGEVHVISAMKVGNRLQAERKAAKYNLPIDSIVVVEYERYHEAPRLKYEAARELGVTLLIDDRKDIWEYCNKRHLLCLLVPS